MDAEGNLFLDDPRQRHAKEFSRNGEGRMQGHAKAHAFLSILTAPPSYLLLGPLQHAESLSRIRIEPFMVDDAVQPTFQQGSQAGMSVTDIAYRCCTALAKHPAAFS